MRNLIANRKAVFFALLAGLLILSLTSSRSHAQQEAVNNVEEQEDIDSDKKSATINVAAPYQKQTIIPTMIPSVLFTKWEYEAIFDAIGAIGNTPIRNLTPSEQRKAGEDIDEARFQKRPPPEERYISLSGLVYGGKDDWIIWLNGKRITPDAVPKEILYLQVYKGHVELKWYDEYSRTIYPIKLKSNQRFNLDTRIFLPG